MNENQTIHEAIEYIIASLKKQGQAPGTLKNYINSFNVFKKYLSEYKISKVDEKVCLAYIYLKTGVNLESFNQKILDPNINRRMKPLHLLLAYLDTGKFIYRQRRIKEPFICPEGFCY